MPTADLFCPRCGTPGKSDARFCRKCGHSLDETAESAPAAPATNAERRGLSSNLIGIFAMLAVLGAGGFAFRDKLTWVVSPADAEPVVTFEGVQLTDGYAAEAVHRGDTAVDSSVASKVTVRSRSSSPKVARASRSTELRERSPSFEAAGVPFPQETRDAPVTRNENPLSLPPGLGGAGGPATPATITGGLDGPAAAPTFASIAAGSVLSLKALEQVCTDKTREGARFRAVLQQDVAGSGGAAIPKGTIVTFVVDRLKRATAPNEKPEFSIAPMSIELNGTQSPLAASVDGVTLKPKKPGLLGALVGAAAVAAATRASGGDVKQTVAGGVAGGAAGAVVGNQLKTGDGCIEKNAAIRITLAADLTMRSM